MQVRKTQRRPLRPCLGEMLREGASALQRPAETRRATWAWPLHHRLLLFSETPVLPGAQGCASPAPATCAPGGSPRTRTGNCIKHPPFSAIRNALCSFPRSPRAQRLQAKCVRNSVFSPWPERPNLSCSFIKSRATYHRHISHRTACCRGSRTLWRVLCLVFFGKIK